MLPIIEEKKLFQEVLGLNPVAQKTVGSKFQEVLPLKELNTVNQFKEFQITNQTESKYSFI